MCSNLQVNQTILHKINLEEATKQRSNRAAVRPYGAIRIVTHVVHKYVSKKHRSRLQDKNGPGPIHLATSQIGRVLRVKRIPQLAFPLQVSTALPQALPPKAAALVYAALSALSLQFRPAVPWDILPREQGLATDHVHNTNTLMHGKYYYLEWIWTGLTSGGRYRKLAWGATQKN